MQSQSKCSHTSNAKFNGKKMYGASGCVRKNGLITGIIMVMNGRSLKNYIEWKAIDLRTGDRMSLSICPRTTHLSFVCVTMIVTMIMLLTTTTITMFCWYLLDNHEQISNRENCMVTANE